MPYFILDTESIPDGRLLAQVKYPREELTPDEAIDRAQAEARRQSTSGSDFLPVTFHVPIAACLVGVSEDYALESIRLLDAPHNRPAEIARLFWQSAGRAELVTFNGRGFDLPLLELAAFRFGLVCPKSPGHLDLMDWLTNRGAFRLVGGLNLLSKILGKPGKMEVTGDKILGLYQQGRIGDINDYCLADTLDTYFVFLRTRVMAGALTLEQEQALVSRAKTWLTQQVVEFAGLAKYLANWGDWQPWV